MSETLTLPKLFHLKELMRELHVSHYLLKNEIRAGRLTAVRVGRAYFVSEDSVRRFLALPDDVRLTREVE